jgi:sugar/nucleoside kinase (ribokinase family)
VLDVAGSGVPDAAGDGVLVAVGDLVEDVVVWPAGPAAGQAAGQAGGPARHGTDNPAVIHRTRGGSAANVAAFARAAVPAAVPARFIGCVGADPAGDMLCAELAGRGVDVRVQRRGRTGTIVVLVDGDGERTMYPDRGAAAELAAVPASWLDGAAFLHVPSYGFAAEPAASAVLELVANAGQAGVPVSVDASSVGMICEYGVGRYLDLVDAVRPAVFFANAHEARLLDVTRPQFAKTVVVVKNGPAPTVVTVPGDVPKTVPVPAAPPARDSTGAGDAFAAGFLAARLRGADPVEAAAAGHEMALFVLLSPGATSMRRSPAMTRPPAPTATE